MSTHAHIVIEDIQGRLDYRFHHYDGYITGLGKTLQKHFNNWDALQELFAHDSDFINITRTVARAERIGYPVSENDTTYNGQLIKLLDENLHATPLTDFKDIFECCNEQFIYLFSQRTNKWRVSTYESDFIDLSKAMTLKMPMHYYHRFDQLGESARPASKDKLYNLFLAAAHKCVMLYNSSPKKEIYDIFLDARDARDGDVGDMPLLTKHLLKMNLENDLPEKGNAMPRLKL